MWPADIDSTSLLRVFSVANTPAYLYKRLRQEPTLRALAERLSAPELGALFNELASQERRSLLDVARAYSALIAVSLKPFDDSQAVMQLLELDRLDWARSLAEIANASAQPTSVLEINAPPLARSPLVLTDSTTNRESRSIKPLVTVLN
jgi:hypothetical protein